MQQVIENIKRFRELKNITRESFAEKMEMSVSGYSKIERGEVDLTIDRLYQIAEKLEVDVSQILNFDASQVFNVSNNKVVNGIEVKEQHNHYQDEYKDKYIGVLETENKRLLQLVEELKNKK